MDCVVIVEEDVVDVSTLEIVDPFFESARLLGDGVGGDCVDGGRDPITDVAHEEISSGSW